MRKLTNMMKRLELYLNVVSNFCKPLAIRNPNYWNQHRVATSIYFWHHFHTCRYCCNSSWFLRFVLCIIMCLLVVVVSFVNLYQLYVDMMSSLNLLMALAKFLRMKLSGSSCLWNVQMKHFIWICCMPLFIAVLNILAFELKNPKVFWGAAIVTVNNDLNCSLLFTYFKALP